ncbi:MAG: CpXC domain-containing protein [Candidatus Odinarchaeota archaeon]
MTRLTSTEIICPHCKHSFRVMWEASINTWLNPELIQKLLDDKYYYECPNCMKQIHLVTKILINCPKGMFWISNDEKVETKKKILKDYDVINEEGEILTPIMGIDLPVENHPGLSSNIAKEIEKFKNELLDNNNNNF